MRRSIIAIHRGRVTGTTECSASNDVDGMTVLRHQVAGLSSLCFSSRELPDGSGSVIPLEQARSGLPSKSHRTMSPGLWITSNRSDA